MLQRINDELGGDFHLEDFEHRALYNAKLGRVELDLVSRIDQCVTVAGTVFGFRAGEAIRTNTLTSTRFLNSPTWQLQLV